jgi:hypothetical protein
MVVLAILAFASLSGCVMPNKGTPVFIDMRAGDFWSGKGMLVEVTEDKQRCRVTVRDRALIIHDVWTDCSRVHPRLSG